MRYVVVCSLLLFGCDHPDGWEYNVYAPKDATPERLLEIGDMLESRGYKRIRIQTIDFGRETLISATKTEGGAK